MKKVPQFRKKTLAALIFLLILLSCVFYIVNPSRRFHRLLTQIFREEMASDTLSMHYTLACPEDYGISEKTAVLPLYSGEALLASDIRTEQTLRALQQIPTFLMNEEDRLLYRLLENELTLQAAAGDYLYYDEPLSPGSGIQSNLPILLAEYTFRTRQDVENYLTLLSILPGYLAGIAQYEADKAQAGLFMSDTCADKVITQCYQIMERQKLEDGTHFLITTFDRRLEALTERQLLTGQEAAAYRERNAALLLEDVMPAYERLGDQILLLKGSGAPEQGLAHLPSGKDYYALLFARTTGSSHSIEEIKALLTGQLKEDSQALAGILNGSPELLSLSGEDFFPGGTPEQYLEDLQMRIQEDFPAFPAADALPSHTVKQVSESLEDYCSPAFYLTPPIDDITENSIYINQKEEPSGLELYTTLAHEGYPGHLYQTVYHQLCQQANGCDPARSLFHYGGYSEGWALYVELYSYDYAKELLREHGASENALRYVDVLRLNRSIQLCLYSLLDIAIHYDGADLQQVRTCLSGFGISDPELTKSIYEYIAEEPVNYPKYYVGYLEFRLLRAAAEKAWQEDYSDLRFHRMILETGPCPFPILQERIGSEAGSGPPDPEPDNRNNTDTLPMEQTRVISAFP